MIWRSDILESFSKLIVNINLTTLALAVPVAQIVLHCIALGLIFKEHAYKKNVSSESLWIT